MIPLDEATAFVLAGCEPLPPRRFRCAAAVGCVLAEDVVAGEDVPAFANTAMDGYAVRAADVAGAPVTLPVVAEVAAGHPAPRPLATGEAMRIFTGAPIPEGADAVVMVEWTERRDGGRADENRADRDGGEVRAGGAGDGGLAHRAGGGGAVEIRQSVEPGNFIRRPGEDLRAGQTVFSAGDELTPAHLGVLASLGVPQVTAHPRPRVGVLSTGDELVETIRPAGSGTAVSQATAAPTRLRPGQIRDSNRPTLLALVAHSGFEPVDLGIARDDEAAITAAVERGVATCDAVLSSGGVSMGDTDLVKVVLDRLGDMRWVQVAIRPAKPLAFGLLGAGSRQVPVFGLPGNPVSSLVSFELFARPALRRAAGHPPERLHRPRLSAVADEALVRRPDGKIHFARVRASVDGAGVLHVRSAGGQGSHQLTAAAHADALAVLPDGGGAAAGDRVQVILLTDPPALAT